MSCVTFIAFLTFLALLAFTALRALRALRWMETPLKPQNSGKAVYSLWLNILAVYYCGCFSAFFVNDKELLNLNIEALAKMVAKTIS